MNPLAESPKVRKVVYTILWVAGLVLGAAQVAVASVDADQPGLLTAALAVFPVVASYVGYTASQNTPSQED